MSTNLVERVSKSTMFMLVCGVVTACDILAIDLHGDPSDCMGSSPLITSLDLFSTVALFQFSFFKSRKTNFNYFLQR